MVVRKRKSIKSKQNKNDACHESVNDERCATMIDSSSINNKNNTHDNVAVQQHQHNKCNEVNDPLGSSSDSTSELKSKSMKKYGGTSRMVFIIVAIEIIALTAFLFFQGENNRYFSNRDFLLVRKSAKETQPLNDEFISTAQESPNHQEGRSIVFGKYKILESYHHDSNAFTQGLTYFNGYIYESTGIYGKSSVRKLDPNNNFALLKEVPIDEKFFGEGMTHFRTSDNDDMFIVLTWKEGTAFIYDQNLNLIDSFKYQTETGEGWGITYNTDTGQLIASDGSEYLYIFDLSTRQGNQRLKVHGYLDADSEERSIHMINELEYVSPKDGKTTPYILANVWFQNYILKINPDTGRVTTIYDLGELCPELRYGSEDVLNGISVTSDLDHRIVYITGKLWDKMYKIMLL